MEDIRNRLKSELEAKKLSAAQAARDAGEADSQGLRDVLSGRKRLSAELLGALVRGTGIDGTYVLTGQTLRERAAKAAAEMPLRMRALRESHGIEAVVKVGGITAKQWREFESAQAPSGYPQGLIQRLVEGFKLDPTAFILGQHRSVTTSAPEEVVLMENYRACTPPDQEAIRHHAAFLAARKTARPGEGLKIEEEAHRTSAPREQDFKLATALAKAGKVELGLTGRPDAHKKSRA